MELSRTWRNLALAAGAMLVTQLWHGLDTLRAYSDATVAGLLADPIALAGLTAGIVTLVGALRRASWAPAVGAFAGAAVVFGFLIVHALPFRIEGLTNPYWGEGSADPLQWATTLASMAAGAWCFWAARDVGKARRHVTV